MGFPENEWHGHDLTSLVDGVARRAWIRIMSEHETVPPWDDAERATQHTIKGAVLPSVTDVLDVIHEQGLEALTTVNNPLLDELEAILKEYTDSYGFSAAEHALDSIISVVTKARGEVGEMCANCRDAVTREGDELVGSNGEVTCPESDRPHGPAVPDTN